MGGVGGVAVGVKDLSMLSQQHLKLRSTFVMRLYVAPERGMLANSGLICAAEPLYDDDEDDGVCVCRSACVGGVTAGLSSECDAECYE